MKRVSEVARVGVGEAVSLQGDGYVLDLSEAFYCPVDGVLPTRAGLLDAAVGHTGQLATAAVDLHPADLKRIGGADRRGDVLGPDVAREPVGAVVGRPQHLVLVTPGDDHQHRPEHFFAGDVPVGVGAGDDGGRDEEAVTVDRAVRAAGDHGAALLDTGADVAAHGVELLFADDGA